MRRLIVKIALLVSLVAMLGMVIFVALSCDNKGDSPIAGITASFVDPDSGESYDKVYVDEFNVDDFKVYFVHKDKSKTEVSLDECTVEGELSGDVGTHKVTVSHKLYISYSYEFTYTVEKRTFDLSSLTIEDTKVYNGAYQEFKISGNLPAGTKLAYIDADGKEAIGNPTIKDCGVYEYKVVLSCNNYNDSEVKATFEVTKKTVTLSVKALGKDSAQTPEFKFDKNSVNLLKKFDSFNYTLDPVVLGVVSGDQVYVGYSLVVNNRSVSEIAELGTYDVSFVLTGNSASNYSLEEAHSAITFKLAKNDVFAVRYNQYPYSDIIITYLAGSRFNSVDAGYSEPEVQRGYVVTWVFPEGKKASDVVDKDYIDDYVTINKQPIEYKIIYQNAATNNSNPLSFTVVQPIKLGVPSPKEGSGFAGWYTVDGVRVDDTSSFIENILYNNEDYVNGVVLTAKWQERKIVSALGFTQSIFIEPDGSEILLYTLNKAPGSTALDISNLIKVSDGCTWKIGTYDALGRFEVTSKNMDLYDGNNYVYLRVVDDWGDYSEYKLNIKVLGEDEAANFSYTFMAQKADGTFEEILTVFIDATKDTAWDRLTIPTEYPEKTGYILAGWDYYNGVEKTPVTFDNGGYWFNVCGGEIFVPRYTPIEYNCVLDLNIPAKAPVAFGAPVVDWEINQFTIETSLTLPTPSLKGYNFLGWYLDGEKCTSIEVGSFGNKMPKAEWEAITYIIKYETVEGGIWKSDFAKLPKTYTVEDEKKISIENISERKGYHLDGWALDASGIKVLANNTIKDLIPEEGEELTLYTIWDENENKVTFKPNLPSGYSQPESVDRIWFTEENKAINLGEDMFELLGYSFVEWNTKADGTGESFDENGFVYMSVENLDKYTTLYAIWNADKVNIRFELNGGNMDPVINNELYQNKVTDQKITLPHAPTKNHYVFSGWTDGINVYKAGASYTLPAEEANLEAVFVEYEYKVIYKADNKNVTLITFTISDFGKYLNQDIILPDGSIDGGFDFVRWYDPSDVTKEYTKITYDMVNENPNKQIEYAAEFVKGTEGLVYTLSDDKTSYVISAYNHTTGFDTIIIPSIYKIGGIEYPIKAINSGVFAGNTEIKQVIIGSNIESIGTDAFNGCVSLTNVAFGKDSTLVNIGTGAFYGCLSLAKIAIPDSVKNIANSAFENCKNLAEVTITENSELMTIGASAFKNCFQYCTDGEIYIPEGVILIGSGAFFGCEGLTAINCAVSSKPYTWDSNWDIKKYDKVSETEEYVIRFGNDIHYGV